MVARCQKQMAIRMSNSHLPPRALTGVCSLLVSLLVPPVPSPAQESPSPSEPWTVSSSKNAWISISPVLRGGMNFKITGSSYAQSLGMDGIGRANVYSDRAYDNGGYVNKDASEGGGIEPNTTWNWGFTDPAQYDAAAGTLTFRRNGIPRYSSLAEGGSGGDEDLPGAGLRLQAGVPLKAGEKWSMDLVFGFQANWANNEYIESANYVTAIDTYDVSGLGLVAGATHLGSYLGPFDTPPVIPSPIINNTLNDALNRRTEVPFAAAAGANSQISVDVDQGLYQFSLGAQVGFAASERLRLHVTPAVSLSILDVSVARTETFMFGDGSGAKRWSDREDDWSIHFGVSAIGGVDYDLGKNWFAGVFGGYEWMPDKTKINVGPNTVSLDASGWVVGLSLGKNF